MSQVSARSNRRRRSGWPLMVGLSLSAGRAVGQADLANLPPPADHPVSYEREVQPMLEAACLRCHGPERPKGGFRLDNREDALKPGANGASILPGRGAESPLIRYVARLVPDMEMPPTGKGEPLTAAQIGILRAWIDQGAAYPTNAAAARTGVAFSATPAVGGFWVNGDAAKFREHSWVSDGASGGLQSFEFREVTPDGRRFVATGRVLGGTDDYDLRLSLTKPNLGSVRAGFVQYQKWSDGTGGYYPPFAIPPYQLSQDLTMRVGRAWFEAVLDAPRFPTLKLGYEVQYRNGSDATTQWGQVFDPASEVSKAIYPAARLVDETVQVLKFDLGFPVLGVRVEDSFRGEFYQSTTSRNNVEYYTIGQALPDALTRYVDSGGGFRGANTLRLEKSLLDWLYVSGGYLFSDLSGQAGFNMETFLPSDPTAAPIAGEQASGIVLNQQSQVVNGTLLLGPWNGFSVTTSAQAQWVRQDGLGTAVVGEFLSPYSSSLDRLATDEMVRLRYNRIPNTVLFGEARLQQEQIGQNEQRSIEDAFDDDRDFMQETDATSNLIDLRGGLTYSPWKRLSLTVGYRYRDRAAEYNPSDDVDGSPIPGNGYPGYILARDIVNNEVETRAAVRVNRWLKAVLQYQWLQADYGTTTAGTTNPDSLLLQPGGTLQAASQEAQRIGISLTLTPWRRWQLTTGFTFAPTRLTTAADDGLILVPYAGDTWTAQANTTYQVNDVTDFNVNYQFSTADYQQNNLPLGLPLGIVYDRQGVIAGLNRRLHKTVSANLSYGFFWYHEPTSAGVTDYTAQGVFLSVTKTIP